MGNPAEETCHRPNDDTMTGRRVLVNMRNSEFFFFLSAHSRAARCRSRLSPQGVSFKPKSKGRRNDETQTTNRRLRQAGFVTILARPPIGEAADFALQDSSFVIWISLRPVRTSCKVASISRSHCRQKNGHLIICCSRDSPGGGAAVSAAIVWQPPRLPSGPALRARVPVPLRGCHHEVWKKLLHFSPPFFSAHGSVLAGPV